MATSAAIVAQTSDNVLPPVDGLDTSSARVQDVGKQLAALLKFSDEDFSGAPDQPIPTAELSANGEVCREIHYFPKHAQLEPGFR